MSLKIAFGCRAPMSNCGSWSEGAYVVCLVDDVATFAYFADNVDYVSSNHLSLQTGLNTYIDQLELGWQPMTKEDLYETAGLVVDDNTICDIDAVKSYIYRKKIYNILYVILCLILGLALGYFGTEFIFKYI